MAKSKSTPEGRSAALADATKKARKTYRKNIKKSRNDISAAELEVMKDMLVSLKVVGYTNSQCAHTIGLAKSQVKEIVNDEKFQERLEKTRRALPEAALTLGRAYLIEAVQWVVEVGRTGDHDKKLKAADAIFDRFGLAKVSKSEITTNPAEPTGGDLGDLPDPLIERLRSAPPEVQEKIVALQESFLQGVESLMTGGADGPVE